MNTLAVVSFPDISFLITIPPKLPVKIPTTFSYLEAPFLSPEDSSPQCGSLFIIKVSQAETLPRWAKALVGNDSLHTDWGTVLPRRVPAGRGPQSPPWGSPAWGPGPPLLASEGVVPDLAWWRDSTAPPLLTRHMIYLQGTVSPT